MEWRIYYADGTVVRGRTLEEWRAAPSEGVQVVVGMAPPEQIRWSCDGVPVRDRELWTGIDTYDPFGWGEKAGSLMPDEAYFAIWEKACGDD